MACRTRLSACTLVDAVGLASARRSRGSGTSAGWCGSRAPWSGKSFGWLAIRVGEMRRDVDRHVDLAVLQRGDPHRVVGDRPETTVLIFERRASRRRWLQHDLLVLGPAHELVGPGTDRLARDVGGCLPAYALGGYIAACAKVMTVRNVATACGVHADRVRITTSTDSIGLKFDDARSWILTRSRLNFRRLGVESSPW